MQKEKRNYIFVMVALGVITGLCLVMAQGCASLPTESKLSVARIIARNAGYYMVDHHTALAKRISTGYAAIQGADDAGYQEAIRALIAQALMDKGVRRSDRLLADAADILSLFGVAIPNPDNVTLEWIQGLNIGNLRSVAEAFVEGLNSPVAPKVSMTEYSWTVVGLSAAEVDREIQAAALSADARLGLR
jgi:hypothetical protein